MELCSDEHIEVCYEDRYSCPVCEMESQKNGEIASLGEQITELKAELEETKSEE